jgi:hypothetical protein
MDHLLFKRLQSRGAGERLLRERLSEPLHLNVMAAAVALFGSFRAKVYFDLVFRQYAAFCLLDAADRAKRQGLEAFTALEFGVASGAGLLNMCEIASRVTKATGVRVEVHGFDSGSGLPAARDYRDHPELYQGGDYVMHAPERLRARLPAFASLIIGPIAETVPPFRARLSPAAPIGYVSIDVDYYFSAVDALDILAGEPALYLPLVNLYLDDCHEPYHNPAAGELLALAEFNQRHALRRAFPYTALREQRLFKNAAWLSKIFALHVLDHPARTTSAARGFSKNIDNPYLERDRKIA